MAFTKVGLWMRERERERGLSRTHLSLSTLNFFRNCAILSRFNFFFLNVTSKLVLKSSN